MDFRHNYITDLRKKKRISQTRLGDAVGIDQGQISRFETGKAVPDAEQLGRIAGFFGVDVRRFYENENDKHLESSIGFSADIDAEHIPGPCREIFTEYGKKRNFELYKIIDEKNKIIEELKEQVAYYKRRSEKDD